MRASALAAEALVATMAAEEHLPVSEGRRNSVFLLFNAMIAAWHAYICRGSR
jgi:hypothetical protein